MTSAQEQGLIGGFHAVMSAIEKDRALTRIWLASGRRDGRAEALRAAAAERRIEIATTDMDALDAMLPTVRHQGCIAERALAREQRESDLPALLAVVAG